MKTVLIITILSLAAITITYAHPIHVSVVNMDYTADSNRIVYSIRLFYDDFQSLINFKYNTLLNFKGQSRMTTKEQQAVTDYISRNFILMDTNRETLSSEFTGWKVEDFSVWLYFSSDLNAELSSIIIKNKKTDESKKIEVDGLFISIGVVPQNSLAKDLGVALDKYGYIKVDNQMRTSVKGVYAAGDITGGLRQVVTAAAEGAIAALTTTEVLGKQYPY